jgi:hypothetical protein
MSLRLLQKPVRVRVRGLVPVLVPVPVPVPVQMEARKHRLRRMTDCVPTNERAYNRRPVLGVRVWSSIPWPESQNSALLQVSSDTIPENWRRAVQNSRDLMDPTDQTVDPRLCLRYHDCY